MKKQKIFLRILKIDKKLFDKKKFREYFSYEPTALVNKLLGQNTQDLRKVWMRLNNKRLN